MHQNQEYIIAMLAVALRATQWRYYA